MAWEEYDQNRQVLISAPYDEGVTAKVAIESLPVWFDLGWQKVDGQDYGQYRDLEPAPKESSPSVDNLSKETQVKETQVQVNPSQRPVTAPNTPVVKPPQQP